MGNKGNVNGLVEKKRVKYIFIFLMIFTSFSTLLTAWSILTSLNLYKYESIINQLPVATVEFEANSIEVEENTSEDNKIIFPSKEEYEEIAQLDEVESHEINLLDMYLSPNLLEFSDDGEASALGLFSIKGINESTIFDEKLNNIKITDGRMINDDEIQNGANSVLISEEVAYKNNLKAGDNFLLQILNYGIDSEKISEDLSGDIYEQEIKIVGTFKPKGKIGSENIDDQNLSTLLADLLHHDHDHEDVEHDSDTEILAQLQSENVISLQKLLLLENLNTIYMSNNAAERILKNVAEEFDNDPWGVDYKASYILTSPNKMNEFKLKAEEILPDYFTIYGVDEAYNLWLPSTSNIIEIMVIIVLLSSILSVSILIIITIISISNNKELLFQYLLLGKEYKNFTKIFFVRYGILVSSAVFISIYIAPKLSRKMISKYLSSIESDAGMYFNIQSLTRNLVNTSIKVTEYTTFNEYYLIGASFIYIVAILLVFIMIQLIKKRLLRGILV